MYDHVDLSRNTLDITCCGEECWIDAHFITPSATAVYITPYEIRFNSPDTFTEILSRERINKA